MPRMQLRSVESEIQVYILCGSEGCGSGAVEWSPDIVSRSVKYCKMRVQNGVIVRSESEVQNRVKV